MEEFKQLGLSEVTIKALEQKGFTTPTPIQAKTIPVLLEGKFDVIGKAQTGTGKTAAFGLPILEHVKEHAGHVQAIVLAPTRELAIQVADEIDSLKGRRKLKITTIYGGASMSHQLQELKRGVDIVVGTPGRVIDHINRGTLDISNISFAVLDEADEMLNMGFVEDIKKILSKTTPDKRMLFFSATMPKEILKIAQKFMREFVVLEVENKQQSCDNVKQIYYDVNSKDRFEALRRVIGINKGFYGIVFCKTKSAVDQLIRQLQKESLSAAALHGDISQSQREKILTQFRNKYVTILVATDVAARGIDVNDLTHVINFSVPQSPEAYIHRIGRTGRAGKEGTAITFLIPSEKRGLRLLEKVAGCKIQRQILPTTNDIITSKKEHIFNTISEIVEQDNYDEFKQVSELMLENKDASKVVSAVLKFAFKDALNHKAYKNVQSIEIKDDGGSGSRGGRGRFSRKSNGGDRGRSGSRGGSFGGNRGGDRGGRRSFGGNRGGSSSDRGERRSFGGNRGSSSSDRGERKSFGGNRGGSSSDRGERRSFGGNRNSSDRGSRDRRDGSGNRFSRPSSEGDKRRSFGGNRNFSRN